VVGFVVDYKQRVFSNSKDFSPAKIAVSNLEQSQLFAGEIAEIGRNSWNGSSKISSENRTGSKYQNRKRYKQRKYRHFASRRTRAPPDEGSHFKILAKLSKWRQNLPRAPALYSFIFLFYFFSRVRKVEFGWP
jgi:hypothetical protein